MLMRSTLTYAEFGAGQAQKISGVSVPLQQHWRRRGLLPDIEKGKNVKFGPGEVLDMMIMRDFSSWGMGIKTLRYVTMLTKDRASVFLRTFPGAVAMESKDYGPEVIDAERREMEEHAATQERYLVLLDPDEENPEILFRNDFSDLESLLDAAFPKALVIDAKAYAKAFMTRVQTVKPGPLETYIYTRELDTPPWKR